MDADLKEKVTFIYEQKRLEAVGHKAMLEKLRADKLVEQAAEIQSIDANILYHAAKIKEADKYLGKLLVEAVAVGL